MTIDQLIPNPNPILLIHGTPTANMMAIPPMRTTKDSSELLEATARKCVIMDFLLEIAELETRNILIGMLLNLFKYA